MSIAIATEPPTSAVVTPETVGIFRRGWNVLASAMEWLFGVAALFLGLSILSSVFLGQFLVLGYLLEASGRISRSGRFRDGFVGVRTAARMGAVALAGFLLWLPLYGMSIFAENAAIIDPGGPMARQWKIGLMVLAVVFAVHVGVACFRGGKFRYFLNPLNVVWLVRRGLRGGAYTEARDRLWDFTLSLRLPYYFWLGLRGFVGAFLLLMIPVALLGQGHHTPILGVIGGVLLGLVVLYLPFLQARFARDNDLRAYRELRPVREEFRRAPVVLALAMSFQLLAALPLYLLKIEAIPRDLVFLEGLVFLAFIFPARLFVGWAYSRPARRDTPRPWLVRWAFRLLTLPVAAVYVLAVFLSQHLSWEGISTLYQQHAFLLPVPFVG